ncbi:MAG: VWA domain-containing protein [Polyangiales bacterium]
MDALEGLSEPARELARATLGRFAAQDSDATRRIERELVAGLPPLAADERAALLGWLAGLPSELAPALADAKPPLAELLAALHHGERSGALALVTRVAEVHPAASIAALRAAPALFRQATPERVTQWLETGLQLSAADPAVASAYFGLESRTSVANLRAAGSGAFFDDELGVWRQLIHMLSGDATVITRLETTRLCAPLEREPADGALGLPAYVDFADTREQNRAVYRFLALQLAGRRQFGTYVFRSHSGQGLYEHIRGGREQASLQEELFLLAESVRIAARVATAYPGSVPDTQQLAHTWLQHAAAQPAPNHALACDTLLALTLSAVPGAELDVPAWLPPASLAQVLGLLSPLRAAEAGVRDSLRVSRALLALFGDPQLRAALNGATEEVGGVPTPGAGGGLKPGDELPAVMAEVAWDEQAAADGEVGSAGQPAEGAEQATPAAHAAQGGESGSDNGTAQLTASGDATPTRAPSLPARLVAARQPVAQTYLYDEWDHTIGDYRSRYCRVHERVVPSDDGSFFARTLQSHAGMLGQVRRELERLRPERYRPLRGLEDGEDFDLNALTEARIDARARRTPQTRIYTARTRQQRDVATLFLVDMSASTEQPYPEPGEAAPRRRIIDTLKESLAVMSSALDHLGDNYAIYGFSSRGRQQVDVYPVKAFGERLDHATRARVGGLAPQSGTRMGAAVRHAISKFAAVHAQQRHLMLLSDGFPQDMEYGPDRRSHTYGIQDTAVALREAKAAGITPFCVTVDRAGQDYLRLMCDPAEYLVIGDVDELPRELPKIYRRVVS